MGKRVYISCYSCPYSTIYSNDRGEKTIHCGMSNRDLRLKIRMSFPDWCERRKKKAC